MANRRWMMPLVVLLFGLTGFQVGLVSGQELVQADRGPRFLWRPSGAQAPVEVDLNATPVLRRRVALTRQGATLAELLASIRRQTGLKFIYSADAIPSNRVVGLRADSITVAAALTELLVDADVDVVFYSAREAGLVRRHQRRAQTGTVVGRVTDAKSNNNLIGAEVFLEGTRWRVSTGPDGRYRLAEVVPGIYTLTVRRVGYGKENRAVTITDGREVTVDIALQPVATQLNEIVTTVTGDQRRVELGHVVGRINADSLVREAPVSSLSELLTARVPGLQVLQQGGGVGGRVRLQVRGLTSVALNNQPIIVVDGVRYTNAERATLINSGPGAVEATSPLNDIDPNDIESIEVVKGPSAATLYGTDAANGVVVVTTKRGKVGPARWSAYAKGTSIDIPTQHFDDIYWGWGTVSGVPNNPNVSCTLARLVSQQCTRQDSITVLPNPLNDPQYSVLGATPSWDYGANIAGGRQDLRYYFSGAYENAAGPIQMPPALAEQLRAQRGLAELPEEWRKPNALTKLNLRSNVTAVLGEQADLRINAGYIKADIRTLPRLNDPYTASYFLRTPDSVYGFPDSRNPAQAFAQTTSDRNNRFLGSAGGQWRPLGWLETRGTVGLDLATVRSYGLVRPGDQPSGSSTGAVQDTRSQQIATTVELGAAATARRGRVSARTAVGAQYVRSLYTASGTMGIGLPPGGSVPQSAQQITTSQAYRETVVLGGYLEEMLGLNDRLFVTGALRVDGASTFGRDYEAAVYPKVSASWLLSEEPFLPRLSVLDELRLRYAFGASGKQPDPAGARALFLAGQMWRNGQVVSLVDLFGLGNPELGPERVREHEFGFDATTLGQRLTLEATWFRRRTTGMLVSEPGPVGSGSVLTNLGLVTQRGFEVQAHARVLDTRLLSWDLVLQHANYTTRLDELGRGSATRNPDGGYVEGYPLGARFQRPIVGWQDANGDGIIARNEVQLGDTVIYMGQSIPPKSQTLTTALGLFQRRLRLSAVVERKSGFTAVNALQCPGNICQAAVDRSTPFADQAMALSIPNSTPVAEKGDFTRLREVTTALDLPAGVTRALHMRSATLTLSARNLALWTDFSGADPEVGNPNLSTAFWNFAGGVARGIPQSRTFALRLDVGF